MNRICLFLILVGCGPIDSDFPFVCYDEVFDGVAYTHEVDCAESLRATQLASQLLTVSKIWPNPKTGAMMYARDERDFPCLGNMRCFGMAYSGVYGKVEVGNTYEAVLHELIHIHNYANLDFSGHQNWDTNGYYTVSLFYSFVVSGAFLAGGVDQIGWCNDGGWWTTTFQSLRDIDIEGRNGVEWMNDIQYMMRYCPKVNDR